MIGTPGDGLRNDHFSDRFTCPNCLTDHEGLGLRVGRAPKYIDCECGARLRCEIEIIESSACMIADPDEQEDEE
jgi:hypothetical protein